MAENGVERASFWARNYYSLTNGEAALEYLFSHIPPDALVLSFEMPPWLRSACLERNVRFLDMRVSPLRFGRDLYVAMSTSNDAMLERIASHAPLPEELRLEAALLSANIRMHLRRLHEIGELSLQEEGVLDDSLIFVGQAPYDASILCPRKGRPLRCNDFAEQLRALANGRRVMYKAHPFASEFGKQECAMLSEILGRQVEAMQANAYQLLSCADTLQLVGISSGLLQEASWFDKEAHILFQPFVPLAFEGSEQLASSQYQQIRFQQLVAPAFWHRVLTPTQDPPRLAALPPVSHHHARETFDQWWDYEKVLTWRRSLPYAMFERLGGGLLRQRIEAIEQWIGSGGSDRGQ